MKKLLKLVKNYKQLIFLDLEGTQFSHELIAIGAVKVNIRKDGTIKKIHQGFKQYVLAKNNVGRFVENLTGINNALLAEKGMPFDQALIAFKKYVGSNYSKTRYITFGSHDMRILNQSLRYTPEADHTYVKTITKKNIDLSALINEYVKDGKNNTYSLVNFCKLFSIEPIEPAHDPLNDALMLAHLYDQLFKQKILIYEKYAEVLFNTTSVARPIKKLLNKIKEGQKVGLEDLNTFIHEEID